MDATERTAPLAGLLAVDLSRYMPAAFAARELLRLGARVVRIEAPEGDPLRSFAPRWHASLAAGTESVVCDLKSDDGLALANALCARADVVFDGFRPGVLERLGVRVPERAVRCALTGFGSTGPRAQTAGHDLNYLGFAGVLADTAPTLPPVQIADLCAGALTAVGEVLAALLVRERSGRGARIEISMTHRSHALVAHRVGGDPIPRLLTGGLACYGIYRCADGRWLTVAALEPRFFGRLCALIGREDLVERQYDAGAQDDLAAAYRTVFEEKPLAAWLELFEGEDVSVGPVFTIDEAAREFGPEVAARAPGLGEHTRAWRDELGL